MAPRTEAKSTVLAQFPPGEQPPGLNPPAPVPTTNLLDSTPPQIVRALGQAEPLVQWLNTILGLATWTSGQDWLSFLLVVAWWIICLHGVSIIKYAGNLIPVILILGHYYLSSISFLTEVDLGYFSLERTSTHTSLSNTLREIDTLRNRIILFLTPPSLVIPFIRLPASQPLLLRLLFGWPIWLLITHKILPPHKIVLVFGTAVLCWSAPWARIICIALWRSRSIRKVCGIIIGEDLMQERIVEHMPETKNIRQDPHERKESASSIRDALRGGVKITQTLYQSQRRWIGIGWTSNLFRNEKPAWSPFISLI
jgi:Integral peroxisomal membrane peroxin